MKTIKDLPEHSRPREKLREKWASALTRLLHELAATRDTIRHLLVFLIRFFSSHLPLPYGRASPRRGKGWGLPR